MTQSKTAALHLGIAERGKLHALEGHHSEALRHYREALRMSQQDPSSHIFFQHYTQCVMESLELSGAHAEVISYCEKVCAHFAEHPTDHPQGRRQHAAMLERWAIQLIRQGESAESRSLLEEAQQLVGRGTHPLTDALLNWVQRGYAISPQQLQQAQERHQYFVVRRELVNPKIAVELPEAVGPQL